uniref:Uncharacterized protein n=1 Tax=Panagrolaimus sp. ES5 TaxID=591445 RepID=A0AC34F7C7_9BILA
MSRSQNLDNIYDFIASQPSDIFDLSLIKNEFLQKIRKQIVNSHPNILQLQSLFDELKAVNESSYVDENSGSGNVPVSQPLGIITDNIFNESGKKENKIDKIMRKLEEYYLLPVESQGYQDPPFDQKNEEEQTAMKITDRLIIPNSLKIVDGYNWKKREEVIFNQFPILNNKDREQQITVILKVIVQKIYELKTKANGICCEYGTEIPTPYGKILCYILGFFNYLPTLPCIIEMASFTIFKDLPTYFQKALLPRRWLIIAPASSRALKESILELNPEFYFSDGIKDMKNFNSGLVVYVYNERLEVEELLKYRWDCTLIFGEAKERKPTDKAYDLLSKLENHRKERFGFMVLMLETSENLWTKTVSSGSSSIYKWFFPTFYDTVLFQKLDPTKIMTQYFSSLIPFDEKHQTSECSTAVSIFEKNGIQTCVGEDAPGKLRLFVISEVYNIEVMNVFVFAHFSPELAGKIAAVMRKPSKYDKTIWFLQPKGQPIDMETFSTYFEVCREPFLNEEGRKTCMNEPTVLSKLKKEKVEEFSSTKKFCNLSTVFNQELKTQGGGSERYANKFRKFLHIYQNARKQLEAEQRHQREIEAYQHENEIEPPTPTSKQPRATKKKPAPLKTQQSRQNIPKRQQPEHPRITYQSLHEKIRSYLPPTIGISNRLPFAPLQRSLIKKVVSEKLKLGQLDPIDEFNLCIAALKFQLFGNYFRNIEKNGEHYRAVSHIFNWDAVCIYFNYILNCSNNYINKLNINKKFFSRFFRKELVYRTVCTDNNIIVNRRQYEREFYDHLCHDDDKPPLSYNYRNLFEKSRHHSQPISTAGISESTFDTLGKELSTAYENDNFYTDMIEFVQNIHNSSILPGDSFDDMFKTDFDFLLTDDVLKKSSSVLQFQEFDGIVDSESFDYDKMFVSEYLSGCESAKKHSNDLCNNTFSDMDKTPALCQIILDYGDFMVDEPISPTEPSECDNIKEEISYSKSLDIVDNVIEENDDTFVGIGPTRRKIKNPENATSYNLSSEIMPIRVSPLRRFDEAPLSILFSSIYDANNDNDDNSEYGSAISSDDEDTFDSNDRKRKAVDDDDSIFPDDAKRRKVLTESINSKLSIIQHSSSKESTVKLVELERNFYEQPSVRRALTELSEKHMDTNVKDIFEELTNLNGVFSRESFDDRDIDQQTAKKYEISFNDLMLRQYYERAIPVTSSLQRYSYGDTSVMPPKVQQNVRRSQTLQLTPPTFQNQPKIISPMTPGGSRSPMTQNIYRSPQTNTVIPEQQQQLQSQGIQQQQQQYQRVVPANFNQPRPLYVQQPQSTMLTPPHQAIDTVVVRPSTPQHQPLIRQPMQQQQLGTPITQTQMISSLGRPLTFPYEYHSNCQDKCECSNKDLGQPLYYNDEIPNYDDDTIDPIIQLRNISESVSTDSSLTLLYLLCQSVPFADSKLMDNQETNMILADNLTTEFTPPIIPPLSLARSNCLQKSRERFKSRQQIYVTLRGLGKTDITNLLKQYEMKFNFPFNDYFSLKYRRSPAYDVRYLLNLWRTMSLSNKLRRIMNSQAIDPKKKFLQSMAPRIPLERSAEMEDINNGINKLILKRSCSLPDLTQNKELQRSQMIYLKGGFKEAMKYFAADLSILKCTQKGKIIQEKDKAPEMLAVIQKRHRLIYHLGISKMSLTINKRKVSTISRFYRTRRHRRLRKIMPLYRRWKKSFHVEEFWKYTKDKREPPQAMLDINFNQFF